MVPIQEILPGRLMGNLVILTPFIIAVRLALVKVTTYLPPTTVTPAVQDTRPPHLTFFETTLNKFFPVPQSSAKT